MAVVSGRSSAGDRRGRVSKGKAGKRVALVGRAYIWATFNNLIVTITDEYGNTIVASSSGARGFKGSKKSTPYAAQVVANFVASFVVEKGMRTVTVIAKGPGNGRESAMRALQAAGLAIIELHDKTPAPHNGCRLKKRRRV